MALSHLLPLLLPLLLSLLSVHSVSTAAVSQSSPLLYRRWHRIASHSPGVPDYLYPTEPSNAQEPRNVHAAFGGNETSRTITWSTRRPAESRLQLRNSSQTLEFVGRSVEFVDGGVANLSQWVHRVTLPSLTWSTRYSYRVGGDSGGWSDWYDFATPKATYSPSLAVFGDMGLVNAQSLPRLLQDVKAGMYDAILHVGDFAYDMDDDNGTKGDQFMQMIQPLATGLPYMTCVGNHEFMYNFSQYKNRFSMPGGSGDSMFYSFDIGPARVISISTEFYFYVMYGFNQMQTQYNWLKRELQAANEQRSKRPWLIVMGHRPMYCSNRDGADCSWGALTMREGFLAKWYPLESLLLSSGVDLALWAHEHSYERMWPLNRLRVVNGSREQPYTNPKGTVHIVTGSAGCSERHDMFGDPMYYSAFRSTDYGYTRMQIHNATHLSLQQVSDDRHGRVIDSVTIVQERHGPFQPLP